MALICKWTPLKMFCNFFIERDKIYGTQQYRKISNIRRTESPNLNVSRLVLQLPLPNPMKPGVKSIMKM